MVRRPAAALALALLGAVAPSRSASAGAARPAYLTTPAAVLTAAGPGALSGAERAAAFQRFVDDGAMTLDGVEIRAHAGGDGAAGGAQLGVFASRDLAEGEAYLSVPWDHVLGMHTAMDHPVIGDLLTSMSDNFGADPKGSAILLLMHERHVGEESDWADYIASLPTNFTVPAFWDVATLRLALGSPMVKEFFGDLVSIKPMLSTLEKRVFDSAPEGAFPTDSKTRFEYLLWALSVWHSRASHVPGVAHPVLVPGADFINDARSAPDAAQRAKRGDECAASPSGGFVEYDRALDVANVYTKRPIAKGEEIFEMYGVWPMGDTLHNAGYLPADVGADCAAVRFEAKQFIALNDSALREADKRELKAAMCEAAGIEVGPFTTCVPPHTPERARQLRDFFRAAAAAEVVEEAKADGDEDKLVKMPEEELDARAAALLYKLLRESLAGYERTNEEDEALLARTYPKPAPGDEIQQTAETPEEFDVERAMINGGSSARLAVELVLREKRTVAAFAALADASAAAGNGGVFDPAPTLCWR